MNNAKMWLVVKPTVGVPLFLGAVAVGSFAVHVAVLSNTTWVADFLSGASAGGSAALQTEQAILPASADATTLPMYIETHADCTQMMRVILPDGRSATLVMDDLTQAALR